MKGKILFTFISFLFIHILTKNSQDINIIPKPQEFSFGKNTFVIDENGIYNFNWLFIILKPGTSIRLKLVITDYEDYG